MGGRWGKVKGVNSTSWLLWNGCGDAECGIGNTDSGILVAMCGVRGVRIYWDDHLAGYVVSGHWGVHLKLV